MYSMKEPYETIFDTGDKRNVVEQTRLVNEIFAIQCGRIPVCVYRERVNVTVCNTTQTRGFDRNGTEKS